MALIRPHIRKKLLLDSNLLLLWITSKYDLRLLSSFKQIQMFTQDDATLLAWVIDQFKNLVTTSYVIAETSNLAKSLFSFRGAEWFEVLRTFVAEVEEKSPLLLTLAESEEFVRFGVTDTALSILGREHVVLTMDRRWSSYAASKGATVIHFRDLSNAFDI